MANLRQESIPVLEKNNTDYAMFMQFPAYIQLVDSFRKLIKQKENDVAIIASYLHADDNIIFDLLEDTSSNHNDDLVSKIYTKAYKLFLDDDKTLFINRLYKFVNMLENAKKANLFDHEYTLSFEIEDFEPEDYLLSEIQSIFNKKYAIENIKNRIKVLLSYVSKYQDAKLDKSTPTVKQIKLHNALQNINIQLSEHVSVMINEANYAFNGFDILIKDVESLIILDDENVLLELNNIMLNF